MSANMEHVPGVIFEAIEAGIAPLKAFRIYADRTIPDIAEATRLDPRRLCLIEAGDSPTPSEALALGNALRIPEALIAPRTRRF